MRNNKGVTLVALVITIIVLIILAAVSLATLTGENSILKRAKQAKNDTTESQAISLINTALNTIKTEATARVAVDHEDILAEGGYIESLKGNGNTDLSLPKDYSIVYENKVLTISTEIEIDSDKKTVSGSIDFSNNSTGTITGAAVTTASAEEDT